MGKFGQESYTPLQVGISATDAQVGAAKEGEQRVRSANPTAVCDQQQHSYDEAFATQALLLGAHEGRLVIAKFGLGLG